MRLLAIAALCVVVAACGPDTQSAVNEEAPRAVEMELAPSSTEPVEDLNEEIYEQEHVIAEGQEEGPVEVPATDTELQGTAGADEPDRLGSVAGADVSGIYDYHYGAAVASVEERIYLADVIVRATLASAANGVLTFTAVEYLKGTGPGHFAVSADTTHRDTQWDGHEAILFLSDGSDSAKNASGTRSASTTFDFADTTTFSYVSYGPTEYTGALEDGYTVDSSNPVWLPSEDTAPASDGSSEYIESSTSDSAPKITLAELKAKIAWVEGGEDIEGYDRCIRASLNSDRYFRDWEAFHGEQWSRDGPAPVFEWESGLAAPTIVTTDYDSRHQWYEAEYTRYDITGDDADLFQAYLQDDDDISSNGYWLDIASTRSLIEGTYNFNTIAYNHKFAPCEYQYDDFVYLTTTINVTAPAGTVWEAFFDPDAKGFTSHGGELSSAAFTANSITSTITTLKYENGKVVLETDPFNRMEGLHLQLIKRDGTIGIELSGNSAIQDEARKSLSWHVPDAPWADGDKLMLRLTSAALPNRPPEDSSSR